MTKKRIPKKDSGMHKAGILAGLAAIAAGAYFLTGERGEKNRKKIESLVKKAQKDVDKQMRALKTKASVTKKEYEEVVEDTVQKYAKTIKEIDQEDLASAVKELKKGWIEAKKILMHEEEKPTKTEAVKKSVKNAKSATKKAVKKAAKKASDTARSAAAKTRRAAKKKESPEE